MDEKSADPKLEPACDTVKSGRCDVWCSHYQELGCHPKGLLVEKAVRLLVTCGLPLKTRGVPGHGWSSRTLVAVSARQ